MNMHTKSFDSIWEGDRFDCPFPTETETSMCIYAQQFQEWVTTLFDRRLQEPSQLAVNQCKVFLLDKYFQYRRSVPQSHKSVGGTGRGHYCIFSVFEYAYSKLHATELDLVPPPIERISKPPPPASRPGPLNGLVIGMVDPDPEFGDLPE